MTIELDAAGDVRLSGRCGSDDAERLLAELIAHPGARVDWRDCQGAHTAVVQVLLAARRPASGPPGDRFLSQWVEPLLAAR